MKRIAMYEDFPMMTGDPFYGNDIFVIRYRQVNDLSAKRTGGERRKPNDDLLDRFQVGDIVSGMDDSGEPHQGRIVQIERDGKGNGTAVHVEDSGRVHRLKVTSLEFMPDGEKGSTQSAEKPSPNTNADIGFSNDIAVPFAFECRIRSFDDFR